LDDFRKVITEQPNFDVIRVDIPLFGDPAEWPSNEKEVRDVFMKQVTDRQEKQKLALGEAAPDNIGNSYRSESGTFFMAEFPQLLGVVVGKVKSLAAALRGEKSEEPCFYVVVRYANGYNYDWHLQALEIVLETCDYVLNSGEPEKFALSWS